MATVSFSVPDEVKDAFNATFAGQNKSAIIADLMREAVERVERERRSAEAIERIRARREHAPVRSQAEIRSSRAQGRP